MEAKNLEDFFVFLHRIENEIDINHFKVDDVDYWPLIRTSIWMKYRESYLSRNNKVFRVVENDFTYKLLNLLRSFFKGHLFYLFGSRKLQKADILFFGDISSLRKHSEVQGRYIDNFFDPLVEKFNGIRSVFILRQNFAFLRPINGLNDYQVIGFDFIMYSLKSLLIFRRPHFPLEFTQEYNRLRCNYFNVVDLVPTIKYLSRHIAMTHSFKSLMLKYLKSVDPKVVFVTHYNSHLSNSLIYAAKTLGIPVVDVQHGVINRLHPTYSYANQNIFGLNSVPHAFIVNDKMSYDVLSKWIPLERIHLLFHTPEMPIKRSGLNLESILLDSIDTIVAGRKLVLITLSWENGVNDLLIETVNKLRESVYFMFRLHPSTSEMEENRLRKVLQNQLYSRNYHIHCAKELSLDLLLEKVDLHITDCSTVVIESLKFRKRSIVVSQVGLEYYTDLVQSGIIMFAQSSFELLNLLNDENTYRLHSSMPLVDSGLKTNLNFDMFIKGLEDTK